jgi:hypothetical protein
MFFMTLMLTAVKCEYCSNFFSEEISIHLPPIFCFVDYKSHVTRYVMDVGQLRHPAGGLSVLWWGASCLHQDVLILNEIWGQDKIYILVGTLLG